MTRNQLFPIHKSDHFTGELNHKAFSLAFGGEGGLFGRALRRFKTGHSVLVRLPGACMAAAADAARNPNGDQDAWHEFGMITPAQPDPYGTWSDTKSLAKILEKIQEWYKSGRGSAPSVLCHNLDLLGDGGHHLPGKEPWMALALLQEATRHAAVLALADRDAGVLPERITRLFDEVVTLDVIPDEKLLHLMPQGLGCGIFGQEEGHCPLLWLATGTTGLRRLDPVRVVRLLLDVERSIVFETTQTATARAKAVADEIRERLRSVDFQPGTRFAGDAAVGNESVDIPWTDLGFETEIVQRLEDVAKRFKTALKFELDDKVTELDQARKAYAEALGRAPSGVILHGPPGTGKTHLARWLAGRLNLPTRSVSGAELRGVLWGEAERAVRRLIAEARAAAPAVLIFEEADDLFLSREKAHGATGGAERALVNAALEALEGLSGRADGLFLILTTNRFDSLDSALIDRVTTKVHVAAPLWKGQVKVIVEQLVEKFGIEFEQSTKEHLVTKLVDRFFGPVRAEAAGEWKEVQIRRHWRNPDPLFTGRAILQAMRELVPAGNKQVTEEDVDRLCDLLKTTVPPREQSQN